MKEQFNLVLYIGEGCRFCKRVTDYLQNSKLKVKIIDVWANEQANEEMVKLTGGTQVPCLRINDDYMRESLDIIEKLKEIEATI